MYNSLKLFTDHCNAMHWMIRETVCSDVHWSLTDAYFFYLFEILKTLCVINKVFTVFLVSYKYKFILLIKLNEVEVRINEFDF